MPQLNLRDLTITSPAFDAHAEMPIEHTSDGAGTSPPLEWSGVPEGTRQLALICHDPDAPLPRGFTHWVLYGIPADAGGVPEGGGDRFVEGVNGIGQPGYIGPAPPAGHGLHHYVFWLYALDAEIDAPPGLTSQQLLDRIEDHVIEQARVVATYQH